MKFKVGDKVRCIKSNARKGYGWVGCLEFTIDKTIPADDYTPACYFPGNDGHGVYEGALELVEEKIDFTKKGTKLPNIPEGTPFRCEYWTDNDQGMGRSYEGFISYGEQLYKGKEYILAENIGYGRNLHFMIPLSEIERLAKEQGMIKETVKTKELPKSFGIKQDQSNRLWKEYMAWLNEKYDERSHGKSYNYYGVVKSGEFDFWNDPKHFDQIITLEEWNEIVNGKQEKQNKTMEITREQLEDIYDVACGKWKKKIETEYATRNIFGNTVELTQPEIDEMFKAATTGQKVVLEGIFGKQTKEIDLSKGKVDGLELFQPGANATIDQALIIVRTKCEYANKSFLLNGNYNWEIVTDEIGCKCLVPTRK